MVNLSKEESVVLTNLVFPASFDTNVPVVDVAPVVTEAPEVADAAVVAAAVVAEATVPEPGLYKMAPEEAARVTEETDYVLVKKR